MKKVTNYPSSACDTCMFRFRPKTVGTCLTCIQKGVQYRKKYWRQSDIEKETTKCPGQ